MWSRGGLWVLLMMLNCMSFENQWKTCEGQSPIDVVDGELATDTPGYQKNIFGHIKVRESCQPHIYDWESRPHSVSITEFGAVGDGKTLNTHAFENAMFSLRSYADKGGVQLYIPKGTWLTGSISLISHLTLFLERGATILGSEDHNDFPIIPALPSYGRGRELPGPRYSSLINGENLTDVVITGDNGTIDGQGLVWWTAFHNKSLGYTRGHLVELINSKKILISNLTFQNSPFWTIHPVYCRNVVIKHMTILAPLHSPNTDGIDPDSCQHVCIEDCYIAGGDDGISIKSGWDEYGVSFGRPSSHIQIRRIITDSHSSSGISFGSEMSGGISDVKVEDMVIYNHLFGIRLKTAVGRGGYIANVSISNVVMHSVRTGIAIMGNYGQHPDDHWDREAYPLINRVTIKNVVGENITHAGLLSGISERPFHDIRLINIALDVTSDSAWNCSAVSGSYYFVLPKPCADLEQKGVQEEESEE